MTEMGNNSLTVFCGEEFTILDPQIPALSNCFESMVLAYGPFTMLATTSAFYIGRLRIPDIPLKTPYTYSLRLFCTIIALLVTVTNALVTMFALDNGSGYFTIRAAIVGIALMIHALYLRRLLKVHFLHGHGPWLVVLSWLITLPHFIANAEFLICKAISTADKLYIIEATFATIACICQIVYFLSLFVSNSRFRTISYDTPDDTPPDDDEVLTSPTSSYTSIQRTSLDSLDQSQSPADTSNGFSKLFFGWVRPLMRKGAQGGMTDVDSVYSLPKDITTVDLDEKFLASLEYLRADQGTSPKNILFRAMHKSFGVIYYCSGILKLLADCLAFAGPLLLNRLVNFIENANEPYQHGYYYATGLFLSTLLGSLLSTHFDYQVNKVKLRVRSALITNIYRKTLHAYPPELSSYTKGEITNFMSTDVDRVVNFFASFHEFWSLPFQVAVTLYLLHQQVGIVFLAGLGLAILMIIFNRYLAKKIGQYNEAMMKEKDSRVKLMTEVLLGIKVIKFNAWDYFMAEKLNRIRDKELKNLQGIKYFDAGCVYLWATTPVLISLLTFSIYSALGNELTAANVFTVIALINMLIAPLNAFPWVVNGLMEAWISVKRLNVFLTLKDMNYKEYYHLPHSMEPTDMSLVLQFDEATFSWNQENRCNQGMGNDQGLSNISLRVEEGQFIGVIGTVGAGKSSLLSAILAEMERTGGKIYLDCVHDGLAIVTQEPWIQHATIRDNIVWDMKFDIHRYQTVLSSCALQEDLIQFPDGDMTEVGENGVTLSGGQKARVALARALYQDKSLYLLDDPFAAVDQHVASHIHECCIMGQLANKTRIICTHHTKYLKHADAVVVMENGHIKKIGTPSEILQFAPDTDGKKVPPKAAMKGSAARGSGDKIQESDEPTTKLMTEEEKMVGTVAFQVYKSYWLAVGTFLAANIILFLFLMQGSKVASDWWLSNWVTNIKANNSGLGNSSVLMLQFSSPLSLSSVTYTEILHDEVYENLKRNDDVGWYLMVYGCIAASNSVFTLLRSFLFAYGGIKAARVLHSALLNGILQAPIAFFEVTPVGRILNRFSSDTYSVDDSLPFILNIFLAQFVGVLGTIIITCYGLPWFTISLVPLGIFYFYIQHYYRLTSRELKRLSSISLSPIYAQFTESLSGLTTIRSFRKSDQFRFKNLRLVTSNQRCNFSTLAAQEWFSIRLQLIGVVMVTAVAFISVVMHEKASVSPGLAGLALSYALSVTSRLSGVITAFTETEKQMVAVERESHYINNIPQERETIDIDPKIIGPWPRVGDIHFSNISLRYREELPLAVCDVSLIIGGGEKIGIVGRTGSGKSTLFSLLFGIVDPCEGSIFIDGVDIKNVPLKTLRSNISIIPQDPFLFSGSVKENLLPSVLDHDPQDLTMLMEVLERCNLKDKVLDMGGIFSDVGEHGKRLSVGQRQLLCLARALLTNSKIVCLDEATASVDAESDAILQRTIRQQFRDRTVITIAHRMETVMDSDRVIVMRDGRVMECDKPGVLLSDPKSDFSKLFNASGLMS